VAGRLRARRAQEIATVVTWAKTDAGRQEIQARALVKERARRNLLLVIDGQISEQTLLANLSGIGPEDFQALAALKLIEPVTGVAREGPHSRPAPLGPHSRPAPLGPASAPAPLGPPVSPSAPLDYAQFTAALTKIISSQLGLRGFTLTLAVEKASTNEELQAVAQRALEQIRERKGEAAATAARQTLYGS
jgi:hypothetical protein